MHFCDSINNTDYGKKKYWNERFENEDSYEWLASFSNLQHLLLKDIKCSDKILMLGCGNSQLSEDLYKNNFKNILNVDYSQVVIEKMKKRWPTMEWKVMDVFCMDFDTESFDVIIEKGLLDVFTVHEKDPWNISEELEQRIHQMLLKVSSILRPSGRFISVSFTQPIFRKRLLCKASLNWSVTQTEFEGKAFNYYYYNMTKGDSLSEQDKIVEQQRQATLPYEQNFDVLSEDEEDFINEIDALNLF